MLERSRAADQQTPSGTERTVESLRGEAERRGRQHRGWLQVRRGCHHQQGGQSQVPGGSCDGSILCVSPIVTEVEKAKIELPQQIEAEVLEVEGFVGDLKVIVEECSDNNVADFTGYVTDLLVRISDCANEIMSRP
jgi:hypothetical protein